jgi:hypothetical protein
MLNRSTSACTAAQKSTKSSSLIRQATITAMLLLAVVFSSCQKQEEKIENKIVITKTLVCDAYSFGLVGSGSCLFHYNNSVKGYLVQLKSGKNVLNSSYCLPEQLDFIVEKMKYELTQKDSTILLP